jgi:hypothetical protein
MGISRSKTCLLRKVALRQWKAHLEKYLKRGCFKQVVKGTIIFDSKESRNLKLTVQLKEK